MRQPLYFGGMKRSLREHEVACANEVVFDNEACLAAHDNASLHKFASANLLHDGSPSLHVCGANTSFISGLQGALCMRDDKLSVQSMDLAVQIIELVKELKSKRESIISNQIGRSGTSIGANIRESHYAHGIPDFISKLQIALKESNETSYWLELLYKTKYIDETTYNRLDKQCTSIRVMLTSSINTAKQNTEQSK